VERGGRLIKNKKQFNEEEVVLSQRHDNWDEEGEQFSLLQTKKFLLSCQRQSDSCFQTDAGDVATLINIVSTPDDIILVGHRFLEKESYFDFPFNSSLLGICRVWRMEERPHRWSLAEVLKKCVMIPDCNDSFLCIPLLHV
jgi:hypothetical protein